MPSRSRIFAAALCLIIVGAIFARADAQSAFLRNFLFQEERLAQVGDRAAGEAQEDEGENADRQENGAWRQFKRVWSFTLFWLEGNKITVGKVVVAAIVLVLGLIFSGRLSRFFGQRLLPRWGMNAAAAFALQTIVFYVLVATFVLFALDIVNVPLTVFAFLGGAVAIGVGFGSQNIVNNFISGLILLAERPIRVGDVIEISGAVGKVQRIGARSTRLNTALNTEITIPNSSFLQNNVTNWTLSDDRIRANIDVGVAYGSPTEDVRRLLLQAAGEHEHVLKVPEPFVWFTAFGDNTLNFSLYFWVRVSVGIRPQIESDLRFRIDELFRAANISIAFPQRDVHLDTTRPLEVKVVGAIPSDK